MRSRRRRCIIRKQTQSPKSGRRCGFPVQRCIAALHLPCERWHRPSYDELSNQQGITFPSFSNCISSERKTAGRAGAGVGTARTCLQKDGCWMGSDRPRELTERAV